MQPQWWKEDLYASLHGFTDFIDPEAFVRPVPPSEPPPSSSPPGRPRPPERDLVHVDPVPRLPLAAQCTQATVKVEEDLEPTPVNGQRLGWRWFLFWRGGWCFWWSYFGFCLRFTQLVRRPPCPSLPLHCYRRVMINFPSNIVCVERWTLSLMDTVYSSCLALSHTYSYSYAAFFSFTFMRPKLCICVLAWCYMYSHIHIWHLPGSSYLSTSFVRHRIKFQDAQPPTSPKD